MFSILSSPSNQNVQMPEVGTQKKQDIARLIASCLDRTVVYPAEMIEQIIRENVRPSVLAQRGYATDHIRRAMIENGYVERSPESNLTRVADDFVPFDDCHRKRILEYKTQYVEDPDRVEKCPVCKRRFRIGALLNHYLKRHASTERWEQVMERYFR